MARLSRVFASLSVLVAFAVAAPAALPHVASAVATAAAATNTLPFASDNANALTWPINGAASEPPSAVRGNLGASILGPQNVQIDMQNPDFLAGPTTDHGSVGNAKWPMGLSHNRLQTGGWLDKKTVIDVMPMATAMAGVNMRLEAGAVRELHWHSTPEWAYVLSGHVQVSSVNSAGQNFLGTIGPGDLWYFPAGTPHSLQGTNYTQNGTEFLLVFPNGSFSEDDTFLLTDWLAHVPKEVIAKNFQTDISAFDNIPGSELYIFPDQSPAENAVAPSSPQGTVPQSFTFKMSELNATQLPGGSVKVVDTSVFPVATTIAVAEVTVNPGAMREMHWHPTQDEWSYFLPGDVGYVPASYGHYVENTGNTTLKFLEIFNSERFEDISLSQWLALTPPSLVKAHLNISDDTISKLQKVKPTVI